MRGSFYFVLGLVVSALLWPACPTSAQVPCGTPTPVATVTIAPTLTPTPTATPDVTQDVPIGVQVLGNETLSAWEYIEPGDTVRSRVYFDQYSKEAWVADQASKTAARDANLLLEYWFWENGGVSPGGDCSNVDGETYDEWLRRLLVASDGKLWGIEVGNEPDQCMHPHEYALELIRAARQIREFDPSIKIFTAGVAHEDTHWLAWMLIYLNIWCDVPGGCADVVSIHEYSDGVARSIQRTQDTLATYGMDLPVAVTELGYSGTGETQAEKLAARLDSCISANPYLCVAYKLQDVLDESYQFGLLDMNGVPKPSWSAWKNRR